MNYHSLTYLFLRQSAAMAIAVVLICLTGCTHNNGDIGRWFGTWTLESITVDDQPIAEYTGDIVWKFQNDVFAMFVADNGDNEIVRQECWGTWEELDNTLIVTFGYSDNTYAPGTGIYAPFPVTGLNASGPSPLEIIQDKGNHITLSYSSPSGKVFKYNIVKQ